MPILPPPSPDNLKSGSTEPVKKRRRFSVRIKNKQPKPVRNLRSNSSATLIIPDNKPQKPQPQSKLIPAAPPAIGNKKKQPQPQPQPTPTPTPPAISNKQKQPQPQPTPTPTPPAISNKQKHPQPQPTPTLTPPAIANNNQPPKSHPQLTLIPPAPIANNNKPPKPQPEPLLNPTPQQHQHTPVTIDPQLKPVPKAKPQPCKNTTPTPPPKTLTPSTSNGTTSRPVKKHKCTGDQILEAEHPYIAQLERKESLLHKVMNDIFYLADNDLLLTDKDSGENDYSMTLKFAHKLDYIAEILTGLSSNCTEHAKRIHDTVDDARDQKVQMQEVIPDVQLVDNITKMERSDELKEILKRIHGLETGTETVPWIKDYSKLVKHEYAPIVSSDQS